MPQLLPHDLLLVLLDSPRSTSRSRPSCSHFYVLPKQTDFALDGVVFNEDIFHGTSLVDVACKRCLAIVEPCLEVCEGGVR
jgi:hypothetical protein